MKMKKLINLSSSTESIYDDARFNKLRCCTLNVNALYMQRAIERKIEIINGFDRGYRRRRIEKYPNTPCTGFARCNPHLPHPHSLSYRPHSLSHHPHSLSLLILVLNKLAKFEGTNVCLIIIIIVDN